MSQSNLFSSYEDSISSVYSSVSSLAKTITNNKKDINSTLSNVIIHLAAKTATKAVNEIMSEVIKSVDQTQLKAVEVKANEVVAVLSESLKKSYNSLSWEEYEAIKKANINV